MSEEQQRRNSGITTMYVAVVQCQYVIKLYIYIHTHVHTHTYQNKHTNI